MTEQQPVFEVVDGSIAFGGNQALNSVSFAMEKGQLLGLIGPNGSGKTTLLNATSGIYPLDSGSIRFEGRLIEKAPAARDRAHLPAHDGAGEHAHPGLHDPRRRQRGPHHRWRDVPTFIFQYSEVGQSAGDAAILFPERFATAELMRP